MRYAILSDIHGNLPALKAVLEDAKAQGVQSYIQVGDYFGDFPYTNEVVDLVRACPNLSVIAGNKEGYLVDLKRAGEASWVHHQFQGLYWSYRSFTQDNRHWLMNLPEEDRLTTGEGIQLHMIHDMRRLYPNTAIKKFSSSKFALQMEAGHFTLEGFLAYVQDQLMEDESLGAMLATEAADIIISGHSHIQWHGWVGGKLLINAGSIGVPLDYRPTAAYTILDIEAGEAQVTERRIAYDIEALMEDVKETELYAVAKGWCEIIFKELPSAKEEVFFFFTHAKEMGRLMGDTQWPLADHVWEAALIDWFKEDDNG